MRRRDFIGGIIGSAAAWPLAAHAEPTDRVRRIGVLMNLLSNDPEGQARLTAFTRALSKLGWTEGRNLHTDICWAEQNDPNLSRQCAEELVALKPDVILASASQSVIALQRVTSSLPMVFTNVIDPVGAGFISTMARPGGNTTGFTAFEYSISGKWLDLLRELAPNVKRVAVLRDPSYATGIGQFAAIQSAASSSGMELSAFDLRDASAIERDLAAFSREPNGGVITTAAGGAAVHRQLIISFMTQYRLPNVCPFRYFTAIGGLASYGPNTTDPFGQAASYVDRILKGEKPADLPVQAPTKYELIINLKTAKAIGLTIPQSLLVAADEVIE